MGRFVFFTVGIFLMIPSFSIAEEYVSPGTICHPITPRQSELMEWREQGLVSSDMGRSLWTICPLTRRSGLEPRRITVRLHNKTSTDRSVRCIYREMKDAEQLNGSSQTATVRPEESSRQSRHTGSGQLYWDIIPTEKDSVLNIACELPADTYIDAVISAHSYTCYTASMAGQWFLSIGHPDYGRAAAFLKIDTSGEISGISHTNYLPDSGLIGKQVSGSVTIRGNCRADSFHIQIPGFGSYDGVGGGALSLDRNLFSATAVSVVMEENMTIFYHPEGTFLDIRMFRIDGET